MIKQILLSLFIITVTCAASAQCIPDIESTAVVVSVSDTIDGGFDPIWVCTNAFLKSDGGFHNIYLEPGAVMMTSGGIDTIYVSDGATLSMNGGIHVIFFVNASDVNLGGGIPTPVQCTSITFDYTNAPTNGCATFPIASFLSSDSSLCVGSCVSFSDLSANATSWQWTFPGGNPSTSTDQNPPDVCYDSTGNFDVTLVVSNGSNNDTLTLNDLISVSQPAMPVLTFINDTLFSTTGYATYQWYYNGSAITGATNYFHIPSAGGLYTLVVTDNNGCETSAVIKIAVTGIDDAFSDEHLQVFPNPATNFITISMDESSELRFFDLYGRNIFFLTMSSPGEIRVDITAFPSTFFIRTEKGTLVKVLRN